MADKKISALTAASTPLAGTEVLPIVQSGSTVKVASNDLTVKNVRSNATTGILQVTGPAVGATRVMTVPDANFTAARTDAAQTFTGVQTLTSPKIITSIDDTNGNELLKLTATASAVNELTVANAATGSNPAISSTGGDTNIGFRLNTKGSGPLSINGPLNRFVASGTNADTTVAATISFVSQGVDWISQLIEFQVALSSTAGSSVHGGVVRYILSSLDSGTGLASVSALASDLTGVTAATSVSGNNLTVTFTITGGGNCNRYGISAEVLSSNGAGWWASGMTVA